MYIVTNIGLREYLRTGVIWHGDFDAQIGKGAINLISHGIRRDMIRHLIPSGAAAGIARLDVSTDSTEEILGTILFLS